jgi:hypothetical protein
MEGNGGRWKSDFGEEDEEEDFGILDRMSGGIRASAEFARS